MALLRIAHLVAVAFALCETLVRASYYLDDRDSSITYVGKFWGPALLSPTTDVANVYNGTAMSATCFTENRCTMAIPFNGSGITLYVLMVFALSFNASIDGGTPTYHHFDGVFGCCNSTIHPLYNFSVYNITSLPLGNHALHLTLLDSPSPGDSWPDSQSPSFMDPDYVVVATMKSQLRQWALHLMSILPPQPLSILPPSRHLIPTFSLHTKSLPKPVVEQLHQSHGTPASPNPRASPSSSTFPSASPLPVSTLPSGRHISTVDAIPTVPGASSALDSALATEEARFLRRLYDRNAPAEEIAELLRAMRAREEANSGIK